MNRTGSSYLLWLPALAVLCVGIALSVSSIGDAADFRARLARKLEDIERMEELAARLAPFERARAAYAKAAQGGASPLEGLLGKAGAATKPDDIVAKDEDMLEGWRRLRRTLVFNRAAVVTVVRLVSEAESLCPPWRMVRIDLRAASSDAGLAEVSATLEALSRGHDAGASAD